MREDSEEDDLPGTKMMEKKEMKDTVVSAAGNCTLMKASIYVMYTHFYNISISKKKFLQIFRPFWDDSSVE